MSEDIYAFYLKRFTSPHELAQFSSAAMSILAAPLIADLDGNVFVRGDINTNTVQVEHILTQIQSNLQNRSKGERIGVSNGS